MPIYADDLAPNQEFVFPTCTLSEQDIIEFACQWDPIYLHTDPAAARAAGLDGVIASGLHTLAIYQRFMVAAVWSRVAGGAGRSFDVRFRRPVHPGTTLGGRAVIRSIEARPERGNAVLIIDGEITGEDGEAVLTLVNESVLPLRRQNPAG